MGYFYYWCDVSGLCLCPTGDQSPGALANCPISPAFGFQTGVLYYHANWIGNLAIGITAVSLLLSSRLNNPIPAGIACIAIVWIFTFVNMLGGTWVSRLTTIGLVLVLIPVVMTAVIGWHWFDAATYQANWNTSSTPDSHAVSKVFCSACGDSSALSLPPSAPGW
jgi:amino acid transporter